MASNELINQLEMHAHILTLLYNDIIQLVAIFDLEYLVCTSYVCV